MFKCIDKKRQQEIIILDYERDDSGLPDLRKTGRSDGLMCPECKQSVLVKAGLLKAWHFAHKDLGACPLATESASVLMARRMLYHWLSAKFVQRMESSPSEKARITVEKKMFHSVERCADCFVEQPGRQGFGYLILEKGMRNRTELEAATKKGILHPVFLGSMLKRADGTQSEFDLTPTERGLMVSTKYDHAYGGGEGSLQYLDCESKTVTTLRALVLSHSPQRYWATRVLVHPLVDMLTDRTGILIHPGEHEKLRVYEEKAAARERKRKQAEKAQQERQRAIMERQEQIRQQRESRLAKQAEKWRAMEAKAAEQRRMDPEHQDLEEHRQSFRGEKEPLEDLKVKGLSQIARKAMGLLPLQCERCGAETTDWISSTPGQGTCICRECHGKQEGR